MYVDLDTLATALYVKVDDYLKASPEVGPWRPKVGIAPKITDAELVTLAVMQVLLRFDEEARWLRHAHDKLRHLFPYLPKQPGYNKRLRALAPVFKHVTRLLVVATGLWRDPLRIADSTPVGCGQSRETAKRSDLAGFAGYGYCASHSRHFWGLRPHLVTTIHGLPILVVGKGYRDKILERQLADRDVTMIRPAYRTEATRPGRGLLRAVRQTIESVNDTLKGQLDLEQHGARTPDGVVVRVLQRILALTAAIWHNWLTGQPIMRSLTAYDH